MRYAGVAYMLWLAVKLALAGPVGEPDNSGKPLSFFGAAAFQWINPKAWFIAIGALTAYAVSEDYTRSVIIVALVFGLVTMPCIAAWVLFGDGDAPGSQQSAFRAALQHRNGAAARRLDHSGT